MLNNISLFQATSLDLITVICCCIVAFRNAKNPLHPAWMLLGTHIYIVTFRLFQLNLGYSPMSANFYWPISLTEVTRASVACDLGLACMAIAWVVGRQWVPENKGKWVFEVMGDAKKRARIMALVGLAVGLALTVAYRNSPVIASASKESTYAAAAKHWPGFSLCILHFLYGFPPMLCVATGATLVTVLFFNERFAVVIPLVFLVLLWLARRRQRNIPLSIIPIAVLVIAVWLPMKPLAKEVLRGSDIETASTVAVNHTMNSFSSREGSIDSQFLDMIAGTMTLGDVHGKLLWGTSISSLFSSPIPRSMWKNKPHLNQFQWDLEIPTRIMAHDAMTAGLVGEGYVDFGFFGVVLYCFGVSFIYTICFWQVSNVHQTRTAGFLLYLTFLACWLQIYRDGLISAIWFPFVHAAPLGLFGLSQTVINHFQRARYLKRLLPGKRFKRLDTSRPSVQRAS